VKTLCGTLLVLALCGGLAACGNSCKAACAHAASICAGQLPDFDAVSCANDCAANLDGCKNMDDQTSCVLKAVTCVDIQKCPTCLQP
jgi:hypothetical protein